MDPEVREIVDWLLFEKKSLETALNQLMSVKANSGGNAGTTGAFASYKFDSILFDPSVDSTLIDATPDGAMRLRIPLSSTRPPSTQAKRRFNPPRPRQAPEFGLTFAPPPPGFAPILSPTFNTPPVKKYTEGWRRRACCPPRPHQAPTFAPEFVPPPPGFAPILHPTFNTPPVKTYMEGWRRDGVDLAIWNPHHTPDAL